MTNANDNFEVPLEKLRWQCPAESLNFETTDEIEACTTFIGQERAIKALALGLQLKAPGYNVYVAGTNGTGKTTIAKSMLEQLRDKGPIPPDICYVHNFHRPDEPQVIYLPAGQGTALARDLDELVTLLQKTFGLNTRESRLQSATTLVQKRVTELKNKYNHARLNVYFDNLKAFLLATFENLQTQKTKSQRDLPSLIECRVNVLVDNSHLQGVPVIHETVPTFINLFGTIGRVQDRDGLWRTDFTQIKAGALARANGGYLLFNLLDALSEPGVWRTLKRTLRNRRLEIHAHELSATAATSTLKPEAIDLDLKVVVIADPDEYYYLYRHDDDFPEIFKVRADFDTTMPNEVSAHRQYAGFIKKICREEHLLPFDRQAVAAVIEYGVSLAGLRSKISLRFGNIVDLLREANFWAVDEHSSLINSRHVKRAIEEKIHRLRMHEERQLERIRAGRLMIDVEGKKVGQINALLILNYFDYVFSYPSRVTAAVGMGNAGIINIEREADLSGKTHNKGVAIISGYLRSKYAHDKPLSMSVSITFEQSATNVDGDSASVAEVSAILSALSGLPLRQDLAVTGSMNQKGEVQGIGAVNEKIEGFFNACQAKGLTGTQGVIIPKNNLEDLMLREEVLAAVAAKKFHIYAIATIDEAISLLTEVPAGEKDAEGKYPENTVHYKVDQRIRELAKEKKDNKSAEEKKDEKSESEKKESVQTAPDNLADNRTSDLINGQHVIS
ncbi:MAG: AAA family ATPase [candidate division KSB1 bacterium]|nr:AAA family ATPase [candidate division KSB1 bacterium]MDZ7302224.1 AAA family ATPase [candidate division KSB1 bacterium]MDZ7311330.1 AAA family ATPase [candidate division KSB1 bacterium]